MVSGLWLLHLNSLTATQFMVDTWGFYEYHGIFGSILGPPVHGNPHMGLKGGTISWLLLLVYVHATKLHEAFETCGILD